MTVLIVSDNSLATAMSNQIDDIESQEKQFVEQLKHWLETEAKFYGRTDEDFLITFFRGCKHDMEKAKNKLHMYYENRRKVPQWWANRNISELEHILQLRGGTMMPDKDPQLSTFGVIKFSKYREKAKSSAEYNKYIKVLTVYLEVALRRTNCQKNGLILILDFTDCPLWVYQKAISPNVLRNFIQGFYMAMPVRLKLVHFFNFALLGRAAWHLLKTLLPSKIKSRVFCYGADFTSLQSNIDPRLLPEEYGGVNGRLVDLEEETLKEVFSCRDYYSNDDKYGFQ